MKNTRAINDFLLANEIRIRSNPAISPDCCLDPAALERAARSALPLLADLAHAARSQTRSPQARIAAGDLDFFPASELEVGRWRLFVVEVRATGDAGLLVGGTDALPVAGVIALGRELQLLPLRWGELAALKNLVQRHDPSSTVFPVARGALAHSSLGIGSRFTTLHWPAVAWVMKRLGLSLTANQNSIPRELVYDVDAMLEDRLAQVPFPFIGGSVPEGHQGQSVEGMTHASVLAFLKVGFHRRGIPWGFNADHQPIGGRFDAIEEELARGCAFASYITFDLSPELALRAPIEDPDELERAFATLGEPGLFRRVVARIAPLDLALDETQARRLFTYLLPAMRKLAKRDEAYARVRRELFTEEVGRRYFRELSIDELPGRTTPETLALCLAMAEALGVEIHYVAPAIGFQKNFPYPDNDELRRTVDALYRVAESFEVSIGFHSGSGKSAENYRVAGEVTRRNLEIKTSGRYTYEMGAALAKSHDLRDQELWRDWYEFTRELAVEGAFAEDADPAAGGARVHPPCAGPRKTRRHGCVREPRGAPVGAGGHAALAGPHVLVRVQLPLRPGGGRLPAAARRSRPEGLRPEGPLLRHQRRGAALLRPGRRELHPLPCRDDGPCGCGPGGRSAGTAGRRRRLCRLRAGPRFLTRPERKKGESR